MDSRRCHIFIVAKLCEYLLLQSECSHSSADVTRVCKVYFKVTVDVRMQLLIMGEEEELIIFSVKKKGRFSPRLPLSRVEYLTAQMPFPAVNLLHILHLRRGNFVAAN